MRNITFLFLLLICINVSGQDTIVMVSGSNHNGVYDSKTINHNPKVLWRSEMPYKSISDMVLYSDIILSNCYLADKGKNIEKSVLLAIDKSSGKIIWQREFSEQFSTPSVRNRIAYYGSKKNKVIAINIANGDLIWSYNDLKGPECEAPAIINDKIFFGTHGKEWCVLDKNGILIQKLNLNNGMCCYPSINKENVYFVDWDGKLHQFNSNTFKDSVIFKSEKSAHIAPTIVDNKGFFFNDNGTLHAVDINPSQLLWTFNADGQIWGHPSIAKNICIFITDRSHVYAFNIISGKLMWDLKKEGVIYTSASIAKNIAYFGCGDKNLYAVDLFTGKEIWKFKTEDLVSTPIIDNGKIYFSSGIYVYGLE